MNLISAVENMSEELYLRLKCAVETGKWPEGTKVEQAQRQSAMHLVMAYQARVLKSDEIMTVGADGHIVNKSKRELKNQFSHPKKQDNTATNERNNIARFTQL